MTPFRIAGLLAAVVLTDVAYLAAAAAPSYLAAAPTEAVAAPAVGQNPPGNVRLQGKVLDEAGQPIADVMVTAQMEGQAGILSGTSNNKGEWRVNGLANGQWTIEMTKEGLEGFRATIEVRDKKAAPMNVTMAKFVEKVDPAVALNAELQRAVALAQASKFAEARGVCETLVAQNPELGQCHAFIGRMYVAENQIPKALEHVKLALEKDPNNLDTKLLHADLLNETGAKAEARTILEGIDMAQVKDPFPFMNAAIAMINEGKGAEAADWLTRLAAQFPAQKEIIYYRGRAYVAASKLDLAKADLEAFIAAAPTSKDAAAAQKILDLMAAKK